MWMLLYIWHGTFLHIRELVHKSVWIDMILTPRKDIFINEGNDVPNTANPDTNSMELML